MVKANQLISEENGYKVNREVFDNLSDFVKEQIKKEYLEFLQENADDFQMFDETVQSWYENDPEYFKEMNPNWNEEKGKDWVPDGFEDEKEKEEYLESVKEFFIDGMIESFNCGCPIFAFQDSSYYNMYLFIEPKSKKYKEGAYSLFSAASWSYLSNEYPFGEDEEEEALLEIAPDYYTEDFISLGKKLLKEYPNADMEAISNWIEEHDLEYYMSEAKVVNGVLLIGEERMELVA